MTSTRSAPAISVVMPVHNTLRHLDEAVESILAQTHGDFEFIIYDDASTDGSGERLEQWARRDGRIRLIRGELNLGPAQSSSHVLSFASAPLIARMDADDISMPERLELQARALAENPDALLVASLCLMIDSHGRVLRGAEPWRLARRSFATPYSHGTIMFRREVLDLVGTYRAECEYWEDLDLALRVSDKSPILVLPRPLYCYRHSSTSTRLVSDQERVENAIDLRYRSLARLGEGRGYDDLLKSGASRERVDPRVFASLATLALWANRRPRLLGRFFRRAQIGFDWRTAKALAWIGWVTLSPGTLRALMGLVTRIRNAAGRLDSSPDEPVEWLTPAKRRQQRRDKHHRRSRGGDAAAADHR